MSGWKAIGDGVTCAACARDLGKHPDVFNGLTDEPQPPPDALTGPTHTERPGCLKFRGTAPKLVHEEKPPIEKFARSSFSDADLDRYLKQVPCDKAGTRSTLGLDELLTVKVDPPLTFGRVGQYGKEQSAFDSDSGDEAKKPPPVKVYEEYAPGGENTNSFFTADQHVRRWAMFDRKRFRAEVVGANIDPRLPLATQITLLVRAKYAQHCRNNDREPPPPPLARTAGGDPSRPEPPKKKAPSVCWQLLAREMADEANLQRSRTVEAITAELKKAQLASSEAYKADTASQERRDAHERRRAELERAEAQRRAKEEEAELRRRGGDAEADFSVGEACVPVKRPPPRATEGPKIKRASGGANASNPGVQAGVDALVLLAGGLGVENPAQAVFDAAASRVIETHKGLVPELGAVRLMICVLLAASEDRPLAEAFTPLPSAEKPTGNGDPAGNRYKVSGTKGYDKYEEREKGYNELAAALGDSRSGTYSSHTGYRYVLPRAADAILKLVPPPTSEVDEASWEAFLNGEEGGN